MRPLVLHLHSLAKANRRILILMKIKNQKDEGVRKSNPQWRSNILQNCFCFNVAVVRDINCYTLNAQKVIVCPYIHLSRKRAEYRHF
jgi:hypothetical protein